MKYESFFADALARVKDEQRYRVFVELERLAGRFPHAIWHAPDGAREVLIWCSNTAASQSHITRRAMVPVTFSATNARTGMRAEPHSSDT